MRNRRVNGRNEPDPRVSAPFGHRSGGSEGGLAFQTGTSRSSARKARSLLDVDEESPTDSDSSLPVFPHRAEAWPELHESSFDCPGVGP